MGRGAGQEPLRGEGHRAVRTVRQLRPQRRTLRPHRPGAGQRMAHLPRQHPRGEHPGRQRLQGHHHHQDRLEGQGELAPPRSHVERGRRRHEQRRSDPDRLYRVLPDEGGGGKGRRQRTRPRHLHLPLRRQAHLCAESHRQERKRRPAPRGHGLSEPQDRHRRSPHRSDRLRLLHHQRRSLPGRRAHLDPDPGLL